VVRWGAFAGLTVLLLVLTVRLFGEDFTPSILNPERKGDVTPAALGVPFERLSIASGARHLDAFYVAAPASCSRRAAMLIFHGQGETVADWIRALKLLHGHCIASFVFDYTGHGRSSPNGTINRINHDARAAYAAFVAKTPRMRRCTFGFSMGVGPMLQAAKSFAPAPDCIVVADAFTSLRELATAHGVPRWVMKLSPDSWDNQANIASLHVPVMIVHSRADRTAPFWMGETLFSGANTPKRLVPLDGFRHSACYQKPSDSWWLPVVGFVLG
jgi:alpha-beta hydrolase superfamily lysophospholipase